MMSESSVGVSGVIPGLDGEFNDKNALKDDVLPEGKDSRSTVRIYSRGQWCCINSQLLK